MVLMFTTPGVTLPAMSADSDSVGALVVHAEPLLAGSLPPWLGSTRPPLAAGSFEAELPFELLGVDGREKGDVASARWSRSCRARSMVTPAVRPRTMAMRAISATPARAGRRRWGSGAGCGCAPYGGQLGGLPGGTVGGMVG